MREFNSEKIKSNRNIIHNVIKYLVIDKKK